MTSLKLLSILQTSLLLILQAGVLLCIAPLLQGCIAKYKAFLQCRKGASVIQPYRDLRKLFHKESVVSEHASWIFKFTPFILFATVLTAGLFIPIFTTQVPLLLNADLILIIYLLAAGRFFLSLAGLDTASAFGGMGSSREVMVASLVEPALLLGMVAIGINAHSMNLKTIMETLLSTQIQILTPSYLLAFTGFLIVVIAETGRIPVDNQTTHLELTMIHEAMILEYSGRRLALIEWAAWMKQLLFYLLLIDLFLPWGMNLYVSLPGLGLSIAVLTFKLAAIGLLIGTIETLNSKIRLFKIPELLMFSFSLSVLALFFSTFIK